MKKLLTLIMISYLFLVVGCMSGASLVQFPEDEDLVEVYDYPALSKDQLFLKANGWMIETFNSAESVIQHSDKEEGAIIGKYLMYGSTSTSYVYGQAIEIDSRVFAIIDIRVKEGKAKIEIKPQRQWPYGGYSGAYNYSKEKAVQDIIKLSDSFNAYLSKSDVEF